MIDDRKILLLNSDYRALRFINWNRALKLMYRNKVETVSEWEGFHIRSTSGNISLPSTLRLKTHVKYHKVRIKFSKNLIKKRDAFTCQYCGEQERKKLTIDHIIPVSRGGQNSFENCVTACFKCNNKKNNRLLSEINMKLAKVPKKPTYLVCCGNDIPRKYHPDWKPFVIPRNLS
tara:strand:- start:2989 stop:3513 length:525 start_codon:yes stop_codon:yes gene_type:complete